MQPKEAVFSCHEQVAVASSSPTEPALQKIERNCPLLQWMDWLDSPATSAQARAEGSVLPALAPLPIPVALTFAPVAGWDSPHPQAIPSLPLYLRKRSLRL